MWVAVVVVVVVCVGGGVVLVGCSTRARRVYARYICAVARMRMCVCVRALVYSDDCGARGWSDYARGASLHCASRHERHSM